MTCPEALKTRSVQFFCLPGLGSFRLFSFRRYPPLEPVIGRRAAPTRWRTMTAGIQISNSGALASPRLRGEVASSRQRSGAVRLRAGEGDSRRTPTRGESPSPGDFAALRLR